MTHKDQEIKNILAIIHDLASRGEVWISRPEWIEFSTNNACNLKCVMCAHADGVKLVRMKKEDGVRILDEVMPTASLLTPSAGSEPLMGDLELIMEQCEKHDVYLNLITNATLLDGAKFRALAPRLQKLYISFDSHIPELYEKIRTPAKFDKVVRNIKEIIDAAEALRIPICFVMVFMAENAPLIPDFVDFIADLGGDRARAEIRIQRLLNLSSQCELVDAYDRFSVDELLLIFQESEKRALARGIIMSSELDPPLGGESAPNAPFVRGVSGDYLIKVIELIRERYAGFCSMASHYVKIDVDGTVYPCCRVPRELVMGNMLESTFEEIWNGQAYRSFRRRMHARDYPDCCRNCSVLVNNPHYTAP